MSDTLSLLSDDRRQAAPFWRRVDWAAFWASFLASLAVYVYTLAPTVTLEDSGELAVAGDYLGVPHPPGYPIWTVVVWLFARVFSFMTFRGQPNPAYGVGLASAVFGALAAGLTAMVVCRSGSDLLSRLREARHVAELTGERMICWAGGVTASLLFAFSPNMWSQSVIVEVYSLNAFFLILIFLLTYEWMSRPRDGLLYVTAFVFGLGLTNYQVLLLAGVPLAFALFLRDIRLFRDFAIACVPYVIVMFLIRGERLPAIPHPLSVVCFVYVAMNFAVLTLVYFLLPHGRTVARTLFLAQAGVAVYGLMPLLSDLRNPPMNWGYPRTWEGFQHAISRGQYERIVPTDVFTMTFVRQLGNYFTDLRVQFTLPVALVGFLPFTLWTVRVGNRRLNAMYVAGGLALFASALAVLEKVVVGELGPVEKLPTGLILLLLTVGGATLFADLWREMLPTVTGRTRAPWADRIVVGAALAGAVLMYLFFAGALLAKLPVLAEPLTRNPPVAGAMGAVLLQFLGLFALILAPPALFAFVTWLRTGSAELQLPIDGKSRSWIIATLLGFLVMSIVLIALANPKGDIQDEFIQRVKFISSHALFALWIGYGLILGLAILNTLFHDAAWVRYSGLAVTLGLALWPLHENASNRELVRIYGGAEQNGHDFGWQFGNYQLRGAEAILEELSPDEEPIPNPLFPREMGPNAIFFGGTDPGRFVPTYMIYSARVREDVHLITQNALADNTYMAVMRDLYGDRIWIPAQPDSALAFQRYIEEVRSGKRQANANLKIEGGRVQVSGALGVMEINGILAQMIFERNSYRHDFYVEESYVIPWMYPYLEPHGLIMKINRAPTPLSPGVANADLAFWDWYTRRLTDDVGFQRDVVARKSFSKLRSAIAGLYVSRGMPTHAERAFQEARMLYPLSPEANFRLAQELYLPLRRHADARTVMEQFGQLDPGNSRVPQFLSFLDSIENRDKRIRELEEVRRKGSMDVNGALELSECYLQAYQPELFRQMIGGVLATTNLPAVFYYRAAKLLDRAKMRPETARALEMSEARLPRDTPANVLLDMGRLYADAEHPEGMGRMLERYLRLQPGDWRAWLDLAVVRLSLGRAPAAEAALRQALMAGGAEARDAVAKDSRFAALLRGAQASPRRDLLNLPGVTP